MKKRNGLLELYRFIFAINVLKSHSMFPYTGKYFGYGYLSVEFFYVLTGYFLLKSIDKYLNEPFLIGLFKLLKSKIVPILIPLLVGILFNIGIEINDDTRSINIWRYLWYVRDMLKVIAIYYAIKYFVKNKQSVFLLILSIALSTTIMYIFDDYSSWGLNRALSGISIGMLMSMVPKLKFKKNWHVLFLLVPVQAYIGYILLFGDTLFIRILMSFIFYPLLIHFTLYLNVRSRILVYLGSLSFGLYAYQSIPYLMRELGYTNIWVMFLIVVGCTLAESIILQVRKAKKIEKSLVIDIT